MLYWDRNYNRKFLQYDKDVSFCCCYSVYALANLPEGMSWSSTPTAVRSTSQVVKMVSKEMAVPKLAHRVDNVGPRLPYPPVSRRARVQVLLSALLPYWFKDYIVLDPFEHAHTGLQNPFQVPQSTPESGQYESIPVSGKKCIWTEPQPS